MFVEIKPINPACLFINHAPASIIQLEKWHHVFYGRQQEQLNPTCAALPAGFVTEDAKQIPRCRQSSQSGFLLWLCSASESPWTLSGRGLRRNWGIMQPCLGSQQAKSDLWIPGLRPLLRRVAGTLYASDRSRQGWRTLRSAAEPICKQQSYCSCRSS